MYSKRSIFFHIFTHPLTMKDRIKQLMESQHMTQKSFSEFLEKSQGTISSIFTGRTRPTLDIIEAIKTKFPEVSINWLLFGTGEMYVSKPETTNESPIEMTDKHEPILTQRIVRNSYNQAIRRLFLPRLFRLREKLKRFVCSTTTRLGRLLFRLPTNNSGSRGRIALLHFPDCFRK